MLPPFSVSLFDSTGNELLSNAHLQTEDHIEAISRVVMTVPLRVDDCI
jgi:hypothetical protein